MFLLVVIIKVLLFMVCDVLINWLVELIVLVIFIMLVGDFGWISMVVFGYKVFILVSFCVENLLWMIYLFCYINMLVLVCFVMYEFRCLLGF